MSTYRGNILRDMTRKAMLTAALVLLSAVCAWAANQYNVSDETYAKYLDIEKITNNISRIAKADSLARDAKAEGDYAAECLYLSVPLKYYCTHDDGDKLAERVEQMCREANLGGSTTEQWYYYALHQQALYDITHNNYYHAIDIATKMHDEAVERKSHHSVFSTLLLIGDIYRQRNDMGLAGENFLKAYEYQQKYLPEINTAQLCAYLGEYYRRKSGRTKDDLTRSKEFVEIGLQQADNSQVKALLLNEKAMSLYNEHDVAAFNKVYRLCDSLNDQIGVQPEFLQLKYRKSILDKDYKGAKSIAEEMTNEYDKQIAMYVINKAQGHYDEALRNYEQANHSLNIIREQERRGDLSEISARLGNYELEQANTLLEQERSEAMGARSKAINTAFVIILLTVVIALIALILFNRKIRRNNRKLEQNNIELTLAHKRAEDSDRMKMIFIQNMSHEIRTPLNAIVGFSTLMTYPDQHFTTSELSEFRTLINSNCDMLTSLVDDILTISDLESGKYVFEKADTNINHVCYIAMETMRPRAKEAVKMTIHSELPDDYIVKTDSLRLTQVINNMLGNACKYTEKGEITLSISETDDGKLRFTVTDTGPGIPAKKSEDIFERFVKLDPFKTGTGLGLNICKMIADKLSGNIYLDTSYTGGARFVFEMPK